MEKELKEILKECQRFEQDGEIASYIPELAKADRNEFGICVLANDGRTRLAGNFCIARAIKVCYNT